MPKRFNNLAECPESLTMNSEQATARECNGLHTSETARDLRCHILFIIDELCEIGGAELVLFNIVRLLPKSLFRCSLITFRTNDEVDLADVGCPVHVLQLGRTYDWNAIKVARKIRRFIEHENVSIVHTFFETSDLWAGPIAKLGSDVVLISSRRDLGILRSWKHRLGYKLVRNVYDSVLAVSPQVREFCIQQDGLDPQRVQTLFNGVDTDSIQKAVPRSVMRQRMNVPENVPVVVTVGNIRRVKGIDVLIEAAALVARRMPETLFLVAGRKSEEEHCRELETRIAALGLGNNFKLLGSCRSDEIFSILRMSDVFCLPSRSEGFSNALIEAMACGLPCVATDVGGNREVLSHEAGFLVPNENAAKLAEALLRVLSDAKLSREMGDCGAKIVEERFTTQAMMRDLVSLYQGFIAGRRAS